MAKNDKRLDKAKLIAFIDLCVNCLFGMIGGSSIEYEVIDVVVTTQIANVRVDAVSMG